MNSSELSKWNWKEQLRDEKIHKPLVKYRIVTNELNWVKGMSEIRFCYQRTDT